MVFSQTQNRSTTQTKVNQLRQNIREMNLEFHGIPNGYKEMDTGFIPSCGMGVLQTNNFFIEKKDGRLLVAVNFQRANTEEEVASTKAEFDSTFDSDSNAVRTVRYITSPNKENKYKPSDFKTVYLNSEYVKKKYSADWVAIFEKRCNVKLYGTYGHNKIAVVSKHNRGYLEFTYVYDDSISESQILREIKKTSLIFSFND